MWIDDDDDDDVNDGDDDDDDVDDELLLQNGWTTKDIKPYFQSSPLFKVFTISNTPWVELEPAQNMSSNFF